MKFSKIFVRIQLFFEIKKYAAVRKNHNFSQVIENYRNNDSEVKLGLVQRAPS